MYVFIYLSMSDLLSFIIFNTNKHEISSLWKWINCCNDIMNRADSVIKRDLYQQNCTHVLKISLEYLFCSKNIRGLYLKKYISYVFLHDCSIS